MRPKVLVVDNSDAARAGFNELRISNRELKASGRSRVRIVEGFLRDEAGALFEEWLKLPGHRNY